MRFMVLVPANNLTEAGTMPTEAELIEMNTFNQELINAGVMLTGEGLHPTSKGARIHYTGFDPAIKTEAGRAVMDVETEFRQRADT